MSSQDITVDASAPRGARASTALLRLQADERLVAHVRRGNQAAFEVLVSRYRVRLLAFCRHMLGAGASRDAEDVLQEVFTSAYRAMLGDTRPINVRPWLYRIARNRCLNHLRRDPMQSVEGMELTVVDERIGTAETVHQRAEVRQLLSDIQALPESQRTAILLREIDDLSYEQIAMAMDTTVAAVKSLLVRARVGLAEAAESRRLSCDQVRFELGQQAEGLIQKLTPPSRRHVKECKSCAGFAQDLKDTNRTLAALAPAAGLILLIKGLIAPLGGGAGHAGSGAAGGAAAGGATVLSSGTITSIGGMISAKAATGLAAAVAVTGAAVEVRHVTAPTKPVAAVTSTATNGSANVAPGGQPAGGGAVLPTSAPRQPHSAIAPRPAPPRTTATRPTPPRRPRPSTHHTGHHRDDAGHARHDPDHHARHHPDDRRARGHRRPADRRGPHRHRHGAPADPAPDPGTDPASTRDASADPAGRNARAGPRTGRHTDAEHPRADARSGAADRRLNQPRRAERPLPRKTSDRIGRRRSP